MKYTIDTDNKTIHFEAGRSYSAKEVMELASQFPDYHFAFVENKDNSQFPTWPIVYPDYPMTPAIQPYSPYSRDQVFYTT